MTDGRSAHFTSSLTPSIFPLYSCLLVSKTIGRGTEKEEIEGREREGKRIERGREIHVERKHREREQGKEETRRLFPTVAGFH